MTQQLSDDTRFKYLPPEEIRQQIRKSFDAKNYKYIILDKVEWFNSLTRCKHTITDMPIYAIAAVSERPRAITEITVYTREDENRSWAIQDHYIYNEDYVHQNISPKVASGGGYEGSSGFHEVPDCDDTNKKYKIEYEAICNPITMHHFYNMDLNDLTRLFQGQLMGQNKGSPFRHIQSVAGTYVDKSVTTQEGLFIKRSAPIIQLLSRRSLHALQNTSNLIDVLTHTNFPTEGQVACKFLVHDHYAVLPIEDYEIAKNNKQISAYYPVITAEMCEDITKDIPRADIEFGCFGLGSAGTGVLELLARSTFFNKYMLVDFDTVEEKNLRNQWYTSNQIGNSKGSSSATHLRNKSRTPKEIISINDKFQSVNFNLYSFKYAMAAFDSIETRLEFLETAISDKAQINYLIDARYDELTASIFFINLTKPEEVEFYKKGLLSDKEAFDKEREKRKVKSFDDFIKYLESLHCFTDSCSSVKHLLKMDAYEYIHNKPYSTITSEEIDSHRIVIPCSRSTTEEYVSCKSDKCLTTFKEFYDNFTEVCNNYYLPEEESSCLRQNFIDIYKYASTFIYDAIRQIEDNQPKPFTQVDVTTDPLPASMILRR